MDRDRGDAEPWQLLEGVDDTLSLDERIDQTPLRAVFSELLASALAEAGTRISPFVRSYLIQLLEGQLCAGASSDAWVAQQGGDDASVPALAEGLLAARVEEGLARIPRLRALGDRALFVAGYFRSSLGRRGGSRSDYAEIGRIAYRDISSCLAGRLIEPSWERLFQELTQRYDELEDLLAEVGEFTRPDPKTELLKTYDRYVRTGSLRDRAVLVKRGLAPPPRQGLQKC